MTTNTMPRTRRNIDHSRCGHPLTKQARAMCRRMGGGTTAYTSAVQLPEFRVHADDVPERDVHWTWLMGPKLAAAYDPCDCKGKSSGYTDRGDGVWVCADCRKPTRFYVLNVLGGVLTA